jgi:hypothetical protein
MATSANIAKIANIHGASTPEPRQMRPSCPAELALLAMNKGA